ncbi:hypothetical protein CI102_4570 [Trichoderma harzianum]|uniref:Thioester reductase (TE) domain-containing protein n=1 Tax=Trichoderma harzianum CBS 226.95 TaxID=983964 RepID=A0A2T4A5H7_TRIHA|nr:hypothetical protein M431DRAFT_215641 [Trichoderma harzianum CBS 226.95]PKK49147.1 hypothetical protein CI102_4570 [Trichoderma harzianum]PTB52322.1 hypothetical protein M431DRAFT_215641 [Trichoderma harzianum CBS 226.95]
MQHTVATDYLGTEILHQLLRCPTIHKVVVLVSADNVRLGLDRVKRRAHLAGWWHPDDEQKVQVWQGNLAAESFGLDKDQRLPPLRKIQQRCKSRRHQSTMELL